MGIVRPGILSTTIGTSGVVFAATDAAVLDPRGRLHTFCHAVQERWHAMGVTQAAGLSLRWFRDNLGVKREGELTSGASYKDPYDALCDEAATAPPGCNGLLWAPYLMGERTPHNDPNARAAFVGLSASHTRAHLIRAILEGVAFSLKDALGVIQELKIPAERIRAGGGGARARLWRQIQADVYGRAVEIVAAEEGAAFGAAILAGVGAGNWQSVDEACAAVVRVTEEVQPDPQRAAILDRSYQRFRKIYPALRSLEDVPMR